MGEATAADALTEVGQVLTKHLAQTIDTVDDDRWAGWTLDLAVITLLIDTGLVTIDEAAERIALIQSVLPEPFRQEGVTQRLRFLTGWLRAHARSGRPRWADIVMPEAHDAADHDPMP